MTIKSDRFGYLNLEFRYCLEFRASNFVFMTPYLVVFHIKDILVFNF